MTIVIECSPKALRRLFETELIRPGMSREVPGGATIKFPLPTRSTPSIQASPFVPILIEFGVGVAVGVSSAWISSKLKGTDQAREFIRLKGNGGVLIEVTTPEAITKILADSVEIEVKK